MNDFLLYLVNSSICLSLFYILYTALMRKETYFKLNRVVLLSIVLCSLIIPKLIIPQIIRKAVQQPVEIQLPVFKVENTQLQEIPKTDETSIKVETVRSTNVPEKINQFSIPVILFCLYITGILITFLILVYGLLSIFILYRKAKVIRMDGYRLLIVESETPAFSFGQMVFISRRDYEDHWEVILAHEKEHIRFGHFYDLIFLEAIKIIYWFNPFIYRLIRDMKDIHEFQADKHTLINGIDATKYQLLIIQKSVGHQKFVLANSFNHCQIKNRIVMMNKQKTSKAWRWKVAIFLPLLALLLMAFGKPGEKDPLIGNQSSIKAGAERNNLLITFNSNGKVLINISGLDNRQQLLTKMGEIYHIDFSPEELKEFSSINSFGVPMKVMKAFLDMRPEEKDKPQNKLGIPFNSPGNEFKNWVATARTVTGKEMKITIEGDESASYPAIKKIIGTLKDLNENRYNLITEQPRRLEQPRFIEQTKFVKPSGEQIKVKASMAITIILGKNNSVYYYESTRDEKTGIDPVVTKTDSLGLRKYLMKKNLDVMLKVNELRFEKENKKLSKEDFEKRRKEIMSDKASPVVVIKSTDAATYGNLIAVLDEMELCNIDRYAIFDISDYDKHLLSKPKVTELNPPTFSILREVGKK